jgi:hypothetical protein
MTLDEVGEIAESLEGVRRTNVNGLAEWRFHGRLVARQLDADSVVIRSEFDRRDALLRMHPSTFTVPARFDKHMMVVCSLADGDVGAIEDAIHAAWDLQRHHD